MRVEKKALFLFDPIKGGCTLQNINVLSGLPWDPGSRSAPWRLLHLGFRTSEPQQNVWKKGTLRVDGGPLPFQKLTESFVKRGRLWIPCTGRLIPAFNPFSHKHTRALQLPLQWTPRDPDLMELGRQAEGVYLIKDRQEEDSVTSFQCCLTPPHRAAHCQELHLVETWHTNICVPAHPQTELSRWVKVSKKPKRSSV